MSALRSSLTKQMIITKMKSTIAASRTDVYAHLRLHKCFSSESVFVGDGGSNELSGAKSAGMKTIFTEYLESKTEEQKEKIMMYADFHVNSFDEILKYV